MKNAVTFVLAFAALGARVDAASLTLMWDPPSDPSVTGFLVMYGTQSGVYTNQVNAGLQTSVVLSNLTDGASYYLVVKSYDGSGDMSAPSNEVASGVLASPISIMCPVLKASSSDGNPVPVSYGTIAVTGGVSPITTTCAPASGSIFQVGTTSFSCTAKDAIGTTSSCSSTVTVSYTAPQTTPPPPPPPPPAPTALQLTCPRIPTYTAYNSRFATVSFSAPVVTGGVAPVSTSCTPGSGSKFGVGSSQVTCVAIDAVRNQTSCTTTVTVVRRR